MLKRMTRGSLEQNQKHVQGNFMSLSKLIILWRTISFMYCSLNLPTPPQKNSCYKKRKFVQNITTCMTWRAWRDVNTFYTKRHDLQKMFVQNMTYRYSYSLDFHNKLHTTQHDHAKGKAGGPAQNLMTSLLFPHYRPIQQWFWINGFAVGSTFTGIRTVQQIFKVIQNIFNTCK